MTFSRWFLILACPFLLVSGVPAEERGVYRVPPEARDALVEMKASVRHGSLGGDFVAELTAEEVRRLERRGFRPERLFSSLAEEDEARRRAPDFGGFHSYDEMRTGFYSYAATYPAITQVAVLGYSVQGREIFALKITGNPQIEENEPEVVFWGCIHGNEYGSAEVPYQYALYLCDNYGVDPTVTQYVDDNEIWCIPVLNPDGRVSGSRRNANNVDLNRDSGYQWDGWGGSSSPFSQVETRAVREFCLANNVMLSTSVHCSGNVLFYQWGYSPNPPDDLDVIVEAGSAYAVAADYRFVNSWADYETHGEVLDHVYGSHGALCYTVEVSNSAALIQDTYDRNEAGMNELLAQSGEGLHGTVTDAQTGEPLFAAVWVSGRAIPSYTDRQVGDVHRRLLPGTYDLTVWASGYLPQPVQGVVVAAGAGGTFQVALQPGGGEHAVMVTSVNQEDPNNGYNNVTHPALALGAPDGSACALGSGGFLVLDMGPGLGPADGPGDDFTVTEALFPADPDPEGYAVYAGDAYSQNVLVGTATGTASFDLAGSGLAFTRYLRIADMSGASPNDPLAGMDLDAITVINGRQTVTAATPSLSPGSPIDLAAHPNPFHPGTAITYSLSGPGEVGLHVYDVSGRLVRNLLTERQSAGTHVRKWDGTDTLGRPIAPGVYFVRLESGGEAVTRTVVSVR